MYIKKYFVIIIQDLNRGECGFFQNNRTRQWNSYLYINKKEDNDGIMKELGYTLILHKKIILKIKIF